MPLPLGSAITAGADLVGGLVNGLFASKENKKNRQFQRDMLLEQQKYNDSVISRQQAWNDESNVRARLEAAGYNPYLARGGAATSFGSGTSSLPAALPNPMEGLSSSIGRAANDFFQTKMLNEQIKQQQIQNNLGQIQLDTQNYKLPDGKHAWQLDISRKVADTKMAESQANITAIDEWRSNTLKAFQELAAKDENGQPIVDEDGNPVSNFNADQQGKLNDLLTRVSNQVKDLQVKGANINNINVDSLLKQSNIDLNDEQKNVMRAQVNELLSRVNSNNASAAASMAAASLSSANAATVNATRPFAVGSASWENQKLKYDALNLKSNWIGTNNQNLFMHDYQKTWLGKAYMYSQPWLSSLGGAGIGAAAGYGVSRAVRSRMQKPKKVGFR